MRRSLTDSQSQCVSLQIQISRLEDERAAQLRDAQMNTVALLKQVKAQYVGLVDGEGGGGGGWGFCDEFTAESNTPHI